ncbi:MAG TPA: sulfate reduction electron transfer complex DsrMKJOP subunit DsrJ [Thermodesulfovibrio thiophilus]|nr:sulfate reduction electron transfer complex DsrMKJOP subunit DsrJ [Thermodesulfovibrio thiophilus]
MYDGWKIITGLVVFVVIVTLPFTMSIGKAYIKPEPRIDTPEIQKLSDAEKKCIESKEFMRTKHFQLLNEWRDEAIRSGHRVYVSSTGKTYTISLQNTCMKCHSNKSKFCDECHTFAEEIPYCWDCHIQPKEQNQKEAKR